MHLRALVIELKSEGRAPSISTVKLAKAVHEQDEYRVLIQSHLGQVQGLQAGSGNIVSWARSSQYSLRDGLRPLHSNFEPFSPSLMIVLFLVQQTFSYTS